MRALQAAIGIALLLVAAPMASAVDPSGFDVMGIRLYMTSAEALTVLRMQTNTLAVQEHPCEHDAARQCVGTIDADLPDGGMEIRFTEAPAVADTGSELAYSISLTIVAGNRVTPGVLRGATTDHYGLPTVPETMTWCRALLPFSDSCDPNQPLMRLELAEGAAGVLKLTDLGLPKRLRRDVGLPASH